MAHKNSVKKRFLFSRTMYYVWSHLGRLERSRAIRWVNTWTDITLFSKVQSDLKQKINQFSVPVLHGMFCKRCRLQKPPSWIRLGELAHKTESRNNFFSCLLYILFEVTLGVWKELRYVVVSLPGGCRAIRWVKTWAASSAGSSGSQLTSVQ